MPRRLISVLIFGAVGVSILIALGTWQMGRLAQKEALVARLEERLSADPVPLPAAPDEARDEYLRVAIEGRFAPGEAHVLASEAGWGPGFRIIAPFETADGRRVLVDRGFAPETMKNAPRPVGAPARVVGALLWPDDRDAFTPDPDRGANIWFSRDPEALAAALGTEPVLIVAETGPAAGEWPAPRPVSVEVRNNHLNYAITWFLLAIAWAVMTALLARRVRRGGA